MNWRNIIESLKDQGARISVQRGTKLVTAYDQPALGGVYKLAAVKIPRGMGLQSQTVGTEYHVQPRSSRPGAIITSRKIWPM